MPLARRPSLIIVALLAVACRNSPAAPDAGSPALGPSPATSSTAAPSAAPPPPPAAVASGAAADEGTDFEDQFQYGDAGVGDPALLTSKPGYVGYANPRFSFSLDVPRAFTAMPEPTNGDGLQWRLGNQVAMTASGMHAIEELPLGCASSSHVTAHMAAKKSCWATGKRDGFIFWEKFVVAHEIMFSLRFQYAESVKAQMDPIVTHVNASWRF